MRIWTIVAGSLIVLAPALARQEKAPAPIPGWHPELADGLKEAAGTGRPLMVVFR